MEVCDVISELVIHSQEESVEKALEEGPRSWVGEHERNRRNRLLQDILRVIRFLARGVAPVFEVQG